MANDSIIVDIEANTAPILKAVAGLGSLLAGAFTFKKMIDNAMEAENAVHSLNNAMKMTGTFTEDASNKFLEYAKTLQTTTGVSDDLITQNASLLVSFGRLQGEGLERATKAALDLAATGRVEVSQAFDIMSKAAVGNTMALGKLGVKISETIPETQRFAAALSLVEQRFGGLAEGKLNTFDGAMTKLSNSFNDLLENLGMLVIKSPVVVAFINAISKSFESVGNGVDKLGKSGDVIGQFIKQLLEVGLVITQYVMPPLELLWNIGVSVFKHIRDVIQAVVVVLAKVAEGYAGIGNAVGIVSDETYNNLQAFSASAGEVLTDFTADSKASLGDMFNFDASAASTKFVENMQVVADAAKPITDALKNQVQDAIGNNTMIGVGEGFTLALDGMAASAADFALKAGDNFRKVGASMFQALGSGAGQAFAAFGKAIAKGENAMQAFLNSLISSMGQMAIQLGTQFILQGIAYMWAGLPNGGALIAAGGALAAFGGILSAVGGGGGGGGGASAGGGGGGSSAAPMSPDIQGQEDVAALEPRKPETNITVQVQGNILDRRQTGLELAEVIQETFGTNGVNYNT
jgi:hypothetical protein